MTDINLTHRSCLVIQAHAEHDSPGAWQPDLDAPLQLTGCTVIQAHRQRIAHWLGLACDTEKLQDTLRPCHESQFYLLFAWAIPREISQQKIMLCTVHFPGPRPGATLTSIPHSDFLVSCLLDTDFLRGNPQPAPFLKVFATAEDIRILKTVKVLETLTGPHPSAFCPWQREQRTAEIWATCRQILDCHIAR